MAVIGAGLDLGAGRRGVDMGPSAIRYAGLQERIASLGRECVDWGDVDASLPEATEVGDPRARYLEPIMRSCERVAALVEEASRGGFVPLVLGGDHSVAMGTLGGMARRARPRRRALDRRARRSQPARDLAERQRARDAARGRARRRGRRVRERRLADAVARAGRARRRALARRGASGS